MAGVLGQSKGVQKKDCSKCGVVKETPSKRYCRKCHNEYMYIWRQTHPLTEKQKFRRDVRTKTRMRIKRGLLIRYPCEVCGEIKSEAHHDDYNKPYCVRWLCLKHHREYHATTNQKKLTNGETPDGSK